MNSGDNKEHTRRGRPAQRPGLLYGVIIVVAVLLGLALLSGTP